MIDKAKNFKPEDWNIKKNDKPISKPDVKIEANVQAIPKSQCRFYPDELMRELLYDKEIEALRTSLEIINRSISEYIVKPRVNLIDVQIKTQNDMKKKEKEASLVIRNIEEKLDSAIDRANKCLEEVYNVGKRKSVDTKSKDSKAKVTRVVNKPQEDHRTELSKRIQVINDKYNPKVIINEDLMNDYFTRVARNGKVIKDLKEKNERIKDKTKNLEKAFMNVYENNRKNHPTSCDYKCESSAYERLVNLIQALSLVSSDLFKQLYPKVICGSGKGEEEVYDVFSLWFIVKEIRTMLHTDSNEGDLDFKLVRNFPVHQGRRNMSSWLTKKILQGNIQNYFGHIYKSKSNINEAEIFPPIFYSLYDILIKTRKIVLVKQILPLLAKGDFNTINSQDLEAKKKLEFIKNLYGILKNNGVSTFQFTK